MVPVVPVVSASPANVSVAGHGVYRGHVDPCDELSMCWTFKCTPLLLMTFQHCYQWQPLVSSVHVDILYTIIIVLV